MKLGCFRKYSESTLTPLLLYLCVGRLTDSEEIIREHLRSLRQREAALNALEKENNELHDKVNLLVQEKGAVTRELEKTKVSQQVYCVVL